MAKVSDTQQKNEENRWNTFNENMKKLAEARQRGMEQLNGVQERAKTHREKELQKWNTKRMERKNSYKAKLNKWKAEITDGHLKSMEVREKHLEDHVYKKAELRGYLQELVQQNQNRIARAEECTREQTLARIRNTNDKMEQHMRQKKQVMAYRANALKEEMIGKTQLMEIKAVMRDCPTKRINQLLSSLDMPLLPTESPKEGEEDTNKQ
jgi:flavin-binding protein dodecin